ncbi:MAG TPA: hypothetical protein PLQ13_12000 [Candidatus Krumholzibacteria bacterium]|nr:hypothetical protein [Candidatus Krumholzibacteria bacterium]
MHEPLEPLDPAPADGEAALPCPCNCRQPDEEANAPADLAATNLAIYYDYNGEPAPEAGL